jgi:hypothetical protein
VQFPWSLPARLQSPAAVILITALAALSGCLGEPEIDERWTKLEMLDSDPKSQAQVASDAGVEVRVRGRITYRAIHTGFLVAELRYSAVLDPASVALDPLEHDLDQARMVDRILENSVTAGRATRAVTGFDHLMQDIDLGFTGWVPPEMTASYPDSGLTGGLYLLLYLAEGDEIELAGGRDSLVVTPFLSREYEILGTGLELRVLPPGATAP